MSNEVGGAGLFVVCSTRSFNSFFRPATKNKKEEKRTSIRRRFLIYLAIFSHFVFLVSKRVSLSFFPNGSPPTGRCFFHQKQKYNAENLEENGRKIFFGATKLLHLAVVVRCHNCTSRENPKRFQRAPRRTMKTKTEKKPRSREFCRWGDT